MHLNKELLMIQVCVNFLFASVSMAEQDNQKKLMIQKVTILAGSYNFKPKQVSIKVNVPVELTASKESGFTPHNIVMDAEQAGMKFNLSLSNEPKIIRFTPTKTGKFDFYCDQQLLFFQSHREKGMVGVINVID